MSFDCGDCKDLSILCVLTNAEKDDDDVQSKFEKPLRGVAGVHWRKRLQAVHHTESD